MTISTSMRIALDAMHAGHLMSGSGIGDGKITLGRTVQTVRAATFEALIRRGLIRKVPHSRHGDTMVFDWMISDRGREAMQEVDA